MDDDTDEAPYEEYEEDVIAIVASASPYCIALNDRGFYWDRATNALVFEDWKQAEFMLRYLTSKEPDLFAGAFPILQKVAMVTRKMWRKKGCDAVDGLKS